MKSLHINKYIIYYKYVCNCKLVENKNQNELVTNQCMNWLYLFIELTTFNSQRIYLKYKPNCQSSDSKIFFFRICQ